MSNVVVSVQGVPARILAAVRREVARGEVARAFKPALDQVWAFLRAHPGLRTDGHNIFVYHHAAAPDLPMQVDFGVEVTRAFEPEGEVGPALTPGGEVALAVHVGPYAELARTHDAIHAWRAANGRAFASTSWEIYGDWTDDPTKLETTVVYLLA